MESKKKAQNFVPNDFSVIQDVKKLSTLMSFSLQKKCNSFKRISFFFFSANTFHHVSKNDLTVLPNIKIVDRNDHEKLTFGGLCLT